MGVSFSCPFADYIDLDSGFEAIIVKSIGLESDSVRTALRSISFSGHDSELTILKSLHSGRMIIEGSVSFKSREMEISIKSPSSDKERNFIVNADSIKSREIHNPSLRSDSIKSREIDHPSLRSDSETEKNKENNVVFSVNSFKSREFDNPSLRSDSVIEKTPRIPLLRLTDPKHEAALKLQKVYKSFRTRRKLADCAVLVEQRWWKLLDFAELKRSSISFFEVEKHETAISRWLRARSRAAKVGKGLSKDDKAQKLALQHWLEAIDPRHRYGHNLHYYYVKWCHCESPQPFFYWIDIGDGKEVNLIDRCPRYKLQQQCIKYLGPIERKTFEVIMEDGKFFYKQTKELLSTCGGPKDAKWIFVLSTTKTLYVGKKSKGKFQHSSFLAGGATSAAGRIVVQDGILKAIWPHSGHYRPTKENFQEFISFLKEHNVDLTDVKKHVAEEEEELLSRHGSTSAQNSTQQMTDLESEDTNIGDLTRERTDLMEQDINISLEEPECLWSHCFKKKLTKLQIPNRNNVFDISEGEYLSLGPNCRDYFVESPMDGYETAEESFDSEENHVVPKRNLFEEDQEENEEDIVPKESILRRINSHKGMKSYQLGKQLSCRWTTGAGPRIGCVRDYPSLLQFRALEQVNLSPRSSWNSRGSPRNITELNSKVSSPSPLSNHKRSFSTQQM